MNRTPMSRGQGFRHAPPPEKRDRSAEFASYTAPKAACRMADTRDRLTVSLPKFPYVRSDWLMTAYRLIPCQHCGADDGTVCGAHSNWAVHGKGRSIKASDQYAASLCFTCHTNLDQGSATEAEKQALWWAAHCKTVPALQAIGQWPKWVPVPDTTNNPFETEPMAHTALLGKE